LTPQIPSIILKQILFYIEFSVLKANGK